MLITEASPLREVCAALAQEPIIAFDTEFLFERTYRPVLGLVQLAAPSGIAVAVDPLKVDMGPVWTLLCDDTRDKLVHAGLMDWSIVYAATGGRLPVRVFDTQIAAAFLGHGPQIGYANLVEATLGVRVDKVETHTDWLRRPLTPAQIEYAIADVTHLLKVHAHMKRELAARGREDFVREECERAMTPTRYADPDPREVFWNFKRAASLRKPELAVLRELCAWRERQARVRDLRPHFVVRDEILYAVAKRAPRSEEELALVRGFPSAELKRSGSELLAAIAAGRAVPEADCPFFERPESTDPLLDVSVALLSAFVAMRARAVDVSADTLAPRTVLRAVLKDGLDVAMDGAPLLTHWRRELLGPEFAALVAGEAALSIDPTTRRPRVHAIGCAP